MKLSKLRQIITEEVGNCKLQLIEESIGSLQNTITKQVLLRESILNSILSLFLEPKYKKKAELVKNSPEYKELTKQIKISSDLIDKLSKKLKQEIDGYNQNIESMQKAGIKVNASMTGKQLFSAYKKWQSDLNKSAKLATDPKWEQYFTR